MKSLLLLFFAISFLIVPVSAQISPFDTPDDTFPAPQFATELTFASVAVPRLNVRTAPDADAPVATILLRGERLPILGISNDELWLLVGIGGSGGWVSRDLVIEINPEGIPMNRGLNLTPQEQARVNAQIEFFNNTIGVRGNLNVRSEPSVNGRVLNVIPFGERAFPIARDNFGVWILVNYNGTVGWVSIFYISPPQNFNVQALPVAR